MGRDAGMLMESFPFESWIFVSYRLPPWITGTAGCCARTGLHVLLPGLDIFLPSLAVATFDDLAQVGRLSIIYMCISTYTYRDTPGERPIVR